LFQIEKGGPAQKQSPLLFVIEATVFEGDSGRQLQALDVPHVCLTHDPYDPVPPVDQERLAALVDAAAPRLEARGG